MLQLVCRNCGGTVVFGPDGWLHDSDRECPCLRVAWPPPLPEAD